VKSKKANTQWWFTTLFIMGMLLCMSSFMGAEETTDVIPYELKSVSDTLYMNDTIIVVHTVCAPICSSCARVDNKEWKYLGVMTPPIKTAFPEAYIEDGKLLWRDNDPYDYTPCP
jgi:hypothetical protein